MAKEEKNQEHVEMEVEQPDTEAEVKKKEAGTETDPVSEEAEDLASLLSSLEEQQQRAEDYLSRLARVQADYDNYKRRTRQEKEEFARYASEQLVVALLPVLDNFDRALVAEGQDLDSFKSGMEMIYRQLQNVLQAEGLAPVPAVGEIFDPTMHEAVLREECAEQPENTIIEELQRGYYLKEKLIRVSMVKIAQ